MTKQELVTIIEENFIDKDGDINLTNLTFKKAKSLNISEISINGNIYQHSHTNKGDVIQSTHKNFGDVYQNSNKNFGDVYDHSHENTGNIIDKTK